MCTTKTGEGNFGSISQGLSGKQLMPWCFITGVLGDLKTGVSEAIQRLTTARSGYRHKDLERPKDRGGMYHCGPCAPS